MTPLFFMYIHVNVLLHIRLHYSSWLQCFVCKHMSREITMNSAGHPQDQRGSDHWVVLFLENQREVLEHWKPARQPLLKGCPLLKMCKVLPAVQGLCTAKRPLMHNQFWEACCPGVLSSVAGAHKWGVKEWCFIPALLPLGQHSTYTCRTV